MVIFIGIYIINLGYGFDGTFSTLQSYTFVCEAFSGAEAPGNRFATGIFRLLPLPFPSQFVLGVDSQQRDFEVYPYPSYLAGEWRQGGWWYYYLYGTLVKLPVSLLCLLFLSVAARLAYCLAHREMFIYELVVTAPVMVVFVTASAQTAFNHHYRYVLPSLAFMIVILGSLCSASQPLSRMFRVVIFLLVFGCVVESMAVYPYTLTYFNQLSGGPIQGHEHLLGSSFDSGQELFRLKRHTQGPLILVCTGSMARMAALIDIATVHPRHIIMSGTNTLAVAESFITHPYTLAISAAELHRLQYDGRSGIALDRTHGDDKKIRRFSINDARRCGVYLLLEPEPGADPVSSSPR